MTGTGRQVCLDASGDEHITCSHDMRIDFVLKLTECHSEVEMKVV
jgi:hypothetical protein